MRPIVVERNIVRFIKFMEIPFDLEKVIFDKNYFIQAPGEVTGDGQEYMTNEPQQFCQIFCKNPQNLVKQRITPHFLTTDHPNYYEFTTKE